MTHILGLLLWGNKWWAHGQLLKRTRRRNYSVPIVYLPKTGTCQIFACTQWTKIGNSILKFLGNTKTLLRIFVQAICTLISNLSGGPDIFLGSGTFKKLGTLLFAKSRMQKKQGHCYSKREETRLPLLFLNNNDLGFLHPVFFKKQGARFFFRVTNLPWFSKQE